jgi:hypothetical protein
MRLVGRRVSTSPERERGVLLNLSLALGACLETASKEGDMAPEELLTVLRERPFQPFRIALIEGNPEFR